MSGSDAGGYSAIRASAIDKDDIELVAANAKRAGRFSEAGREHLKIESTSLRHKARPGDNEP
jgi:hypothetical protein